MIAASCVAQQSERIGSRTGFGGSGGNSPVIRAQAITMPSKIALFVMYLPRFASITDRTSGLGW